MRIGVALVQQESNTFAVRPTGLEQFTIRTGHDAAEHVAGANSEMRGAIDAIAAAGHEAVPLVYAWALPSGPLTAAAFEALQTLLTDRVGAAAALDGLVLCLHGSMVASGHPDADAELIESARRALRTDGPVGVSLDLHANVTRRMVAAADAMVGYHTDPHVDMAAAGSAVAGQVVGVLAGVMRPALALAKRPMLIPAEAMNTTTGPLAAVRAEADAAGAIDVSLFPVQPWLDVPELGFGVLATTDGDEAGARRLADRFADAVWRARPDFAVPRFLTPGAAVAAARSSTVRPFLIAESADAPTAGAAGDSPAMVAALLERGRGLVSAVPIVDPAAAAACHHAGVGGTVDLTVGAGIDTRWWSPVPFSGVVAHVGEGSYRLAGKGFTGLMVDMGRHAVVTAGGISLLVTEKPAWTADPATFRFAGIDPFALDVLVVRSCSDFRPNYPASAAAAVTLDVPGAATPRLENLEFSVADRPLWPLDPFPDGG